MATTRKSEASAEISKSDSEPAAPQLDLRQIRTHARRLEEDLRAIKAELATMKAKYTCADDPDADSTH